MLFKKQKAVEQRGSNARIRERWPAVHQISSLAPRTLRKVPLQLTVWGPCSLPQENETNGTRVSHPLIPRQFPLKFSFLPWLSPLLLLTLKNCSIHSNCFTVAPGTSIYHQRLDLMHNQRWQDQKVFPLSPDPGSSNSWEKGSLHNL